MEDGDWDVEDVICVVDDMEATDCSGPFVQGEGSEKWERFDKDSMSEIDGGVHNADGANVDAGGDLASANCQLFFCEENTTVMYCIIGTVAGLHEGS